MRLIDADAFNDWILSHFAEPQSALILTLQGFIAEQPTAYDIDKAVEELEKQRDIIFQNTDSKIRTVRANAWNKIDILNKAIEIVKQGGVSDDVCEWKYNDTEYYWESSCEHLHIFMSDGPKQNEYSFCPYCGKKIKVVE